MASTAPGRRREALSADRGSRGLPTDVLPSPRKPRPASIPEPTDTRTPPPRPNPHHTFPTSSGAAASHELTHSVGSKTLIHHGDHWFQKNKNKSSLPFPSACYQKITVWGPENPRPVLDSSPHPQC